VLVRLIFGIGIIRIDYEEPTEEFKKIGVKRLGKRKNIRLEYDSAFLLNYLTKVLVIREDT
jgi:hypothetical protein